MSKLHDLAELGQSIWLDYMRRGMLDSGELNQLEALGVRGVTSNPSLFEKAIAHSDDYDDDLRQLVMEGKTALDIYEMLAVEDIQRACDIFASLYHQTDGADGYVSLEANPNLAYDTEGTILEARRLYAAINRPNAYIKVPATPEGIPAIRQLTSEGISVNVTLIFGLSAYEAVAEAYIAGLEALAAKGGDLSKVSSVASFFVSRVDSKVDKALDAMGNKEVRGKIGIANAKMAYQRFLELFNSPRWQRLAELDAQVQRPLWGSTSTKDPAYPDTMYVDGLIGPQTINTVPPETLDAFLEHGTVACTLDKNVDEARQQLARLAELDINLDDVTDELLTEGVEQFAVAFNRLIASITNRREQILAEGGPRAYWKADLGAYEREVDGAVKALEDTNILERIWKKDYTVWDDDPAEIANRLGWLDSAREMQGKIDELQSLVDGLRREGFTHALLLGMGGSSLAPELFARTFGTAPGYLNVSVLDSTDPEAVSHYRSALDPAKTIFIVSSKSGGTLETLSFFRYFYHWVSEALGEEEAGRHFIAITDPGSRLAELAQRYQYRDVFLNDPNIGGRYSALSYFGLVPAALLGIDLRKLLERASRIAGPENAELPAQLGAALGTMAERGRDKLTFILSPEIASFGDWVEQLIAESTGKNGKGILPVVGELPLAPEQYRDDRLFIYMTLAGGTHYDEQVERIVQAGHPVIKIQLDDIYDLGKQFVVWELATAIAGHVMGIQPFNQPNVESAKVRANEMMEDFGETGTLPEQSPRIKVGGISVHDVQVPADTPAEALERFLEYGQEGGYIAVQAYVRPAEKTHAALRNFRDYLREKSGLVVTTGYGPRFLHSTGQLHKGDAGKGLFIQLVSEPTQDVLIPDENGSANSTMTFGVLKIAQALGDARALRDAGRRVIRFQLHGDVPELLAALQNN